MPRRSLLAPLLAFALAPGALQAQDRPLVVIDPGHGGEEIGVEAAGLLEKDLILAISFAIGAEFVEAGWDVVFTRTRDQSVAWDDRRGVADELGADALLMMHAFQADDPEARGAEVYYSESEPGSSRLATEVADVLRGAEFPVVLEPRPWPFLASPSVPTAMIELAHMTNARDRELLLDPAWHHQVGEALVRAVEAARSN